MIRGIWESCETILYHFKLIGIRSSLTSITLESLILSSAPHSSLYRFRGTGESIGMITPSFFFSSVFNCFIYNLWTFSLLYKYVSLSFCVNDNSVLLVYVSFICVYLVYTVYISYVRGVGERCRYRLWLIVKCR